MDQEQCLIFLAKVEKFNLLRSEIDKWIKKEADGTDIQDKNAAKIIVMVLISAYDELEEELRKDRDENRELVARKFNVSVAAQKPHTT